MTLSAGDVVQIRPNVWLERKGNMYGRTGTNGLEVTVVGTVGHQVQVEDEHGGQWMVLIDSVETKETV